MSATDIGFASAMLAIGHTTVAVRDHRRAAADAAADAFDFGHASVESMGGWEHTTGTDEWTRPVFLQAEAPPSERVSLVVRFEPGTADVAETSVRGW